MMAGMMSMMSWNKNLHLYQYVVQHCEVEHETTWVQLYSSRHGYGLHGLVCFAHDSISQFEELWLGVLSLFFSWQDALLVMTDSQSLNDSQKLQKRLRWNPSEN